MHTTPVLLLRIQQNVDNYVSIISRETPLWRHSAEACAHRNNEGRALLVCDDSLPVDLKTRKSIVDWILLQLAAALISAVTSEITSSLCFHAWPSYVVCKCLADVRASPWFRARVQTQWPLSLKDERLISKANCIFKLLTLCQCGAANDKIVEFHSMWAASAPGRTGKHDVFVFG